MIVLGDQLVYQLCICTIVVSSTARARHWIGDACNWGQYRDLNFDDRVVQHWFLGALINRSAWPQRKFPFRTIYSKRGRADGRLRTDWPSVKRMDGWGAGNVECWLTWTLRGNCKHRLIRIGSSGWTRSSLKRHDQRQTWSLAIWIPGYPPSIPAGWWEISSAHFHTNRLRDGEMSLDQVWFPPRSLCNTILLLLLFILFGTALWLGWAALACWSAILDERVVVNFKSVKAMGRRGRHSNTWWFISGLKWVRVCVMWIN